MKKKILLACIFILSFTLVACNKEKSSSSNGESTTSQSNITEDNSIALNETKQTDKFEFTLTQVEFTKAVNDNIGSDYLLPTSSSSLTSNGDKTLLMFSIDLKYIGKEELSAALGAFVVNYSDGYKFDEQEIYIKYNSSSMWTHMYSKENSNEDMNFINFEPLDETHYTLRGYLEIPAVVETETTEPSSLIINILGEKFTYTLH